MFCYFPPSPQKSQSQRGVSHGGQSTKAVSQWAGSPSTRLPPSGSLAETSKYIINSVLQASIWIMLSGQMHSFFCLGYLSPPPPLFFFASYTRLTGMHFICLSQLLGCQFTQERHRRLKLSIASPHALLFTRWAAVSQFFTTADCRGCETSLTDRSAFHEPPNPQE